MTAHSVLEWKLGFPVSLVFSRRLGLKASYAQRYLRHEEREREQELDIYQIFHLFQFEY